MNDVSAPVIQASGLIKRYEEGAGAVEVLRGLDLRMEPGETLSIVCLLYTSDAADE